MEWPPWAGWALPPTLGVEIGGKSLRISRYSESQPLFPLEAQRKEPRYEGASQSLMLRAMGLHQAWEKLPAAGSPAQISKRSSCLSLSPPGYVMESGASLQTDRLGFQVWVLVVDKVFLFLLLNAMNCIIVNRDPPNSHSEHGYFQSTDINILWDTLIIWEVLKFRAQKWVNTTTFCLPDF